MAKKPKNNSEVVRRNRNNRKRGAKMEKWVADFLEMYNVPYSGSNARFGYGDIRDVPGTNGGIWLGECKNIKMDSSEPLTIKRKWLHDIEGKAKGYGLIPFLAFMRSGKPNKYIMIPEITYTMLLSRCETIPLGVVTIQKKSHNTTNIILFEQQIDMICDMDNGRIMKVQNEGDIDWYYAMPIELFKKYITYTQLHNKYSPTCGLN